MKALFVIVLPYMVTQLLTLGVVIGLYAIQAWRIKR